MIDSIEQAIAVQQRRRAAGKLGRAKAVRRWFKRTYGCAVEAHCGPLPAGLREGLRGDFDGCRSFQEARQPVLATADRMIAKYAKTLDNLSNR